MSAVLPKRLRCAVYTGNQRRRDSTPNTPQSMPSVMRRRLYRYGFFTPAEVSFVKKLGFPTLDTYHLVGM